jgi:hypothetical protein
MNVVTFTPTSPAVTSPVPSQPCAAQRVVSRIDLDKCRRSPIFAALLADDLVTGRAVIGPLSDAEALRLTAADPRDLYGVRGLKPDQLAEIKCTGARFGSVSDWRYHHKKLRQAERRAAERARWVELVRKAAERKAILETA